MSSHDSIDRGATTRVSTPSNQIHSIIGLPFNGPGFGNGKTKSRGTRWTGPEYFRGPIPWLWLRSAYSIQPSCLLVALGLWHWRALNRATTFKLSMKRLADFVGLSYRTVQRMEKIMREAGMIEVKSSAGQSHTFTVNEDLTGNKG